MPLTEVLKGDTTLTTLYLPGEEERKEKMKENKEERTIGNRIGDEGAKAMSEMLKVNTTLTSLSLFSEEER